MAATHNLALIVKNPRTDEFLLIKQTPPPKFVGEEYDAYVDSDLYDLPSARLDLLLGERNTREVVQGAESFSDKIDLGKFDVESAVDKALEQLGLQSSVEQQWTFWNYVEEAEFGPGPPVQTVYIVGGLVSEAANLGELCKWVSVQSCLNWLVEVKPGDDRVGPLAVAGLLNNLTQSVPSSLHYQEYPPGVLLVPMGSRTNLPFHTTNLVIIAPDEVSACGVNSCIARGDALIVDPGCKSEFKKELTEIVAALPRKLVVFLTHHHCDHVDGLSIVQKCNPDATLVAHESTMQRLTKGDWSLGYSPVSGGEEICVGSQRLRAIFAPGHTDGHMALLHVSTHSLIVGDHCVGHGSAFLDITSGGNMTDYFQTTYNILELSPHALIPMHGRLNLWPKHMLCAYLKNRRDRESSILKMIEDGANTLFDIVSNIYSDVDPSAWIYAASNVRLHVEHLTKQHKLPEGFSLENFNRSCVAFADKVGQLQADARNNLQPTSA